MPLWVVGIPVARIHSESSCSDNGRTGSRNTALMETDPHYLATLAWTHVYFVTFPFVDRPAKGSGVLRQSSVEHALQQAAMAGCTPVPGTIMIILLTYVSI